MWAKFIGGPRGSQWAGHAHLNINTFTCSPHNNKLPISQKGQNPRQSIANGLKRLVLTVMPSQKYGPSTPFTSCADYVSSMTSAVQRLSVVALVSSCDRVGRRTARLYTSCECMIYGAGTRVKVLRIITLGSQSSQNTASHNAHGFTQTRLAQTHK